MMTLFLGGVSTKPEVDALLHHFQPMAGTIIQCEAAARVCGHAVKTNRFKTVTDRWRKIIERNSGVRSERVDGTFRFLTADEAHEKVRADMHHVGKATGKMHVRASAVDTSSLSEEKKDTHSLLVRETAAILEAVRKSAKAVAGPKPVSSNIRIAK